MSIITDLYNTLNTNAGVRAIVGINTSPQQSHIYPAHAPDSISIPYIVYEVLDGTQEDTLKGVGDMEHQVIQMECNQSTVSLAEALGDAVFSALEGNGYLDFRHGSTYRTDTKTYTVFIRWSFRS
jgi:hypothetical protein